ncbi:MAG: hypothetical protein E7055_17825 [Lentisphaerae bacterium]|nr:hypothetical protein [Lentisphaerota bacterium]
MKSLKHQVKSLKNASIRAALCLSVSVCVLALLTGCDFNLTADQKKELAQKIVNVLAEKGQERAVAYVEQLESEGKITPEKAEKIKAAIPLGVEKVKTVIEQKIEAKNE